MGEKIGCILIMVGLLLIMNILFQEHMKRMAAKDTIANLLGYYVFLILIFIQAVATIAISFRTVELIIFGGN